MATFAEKQLAKYGWSEGMGLGKNNDGIKEPLKAHKKSDKLGLGSNENEENHKHWWDLVYNKTVGNINVAEKDGEIAIDGNAEFDMKKERPSAQRGVFEESFVKTGTLTGDSYFQSGSFKEKDEEEKKSKANGLLVDMSDAALLKLCGGKTGHKGARHGIKMSGKMARLEKAQKLEVSRKVVEPELSNSQVTYRDRQVNEEFEAVRTVRRESKHVNIQWTYGDSNADDFSEDAVGFGPIHAEQADYFSEIVEKKKKSKKRKSEIEINETADDNSSEDAVGFSSQKAIDEKLSNEFNAADDKVDESVINDDGDLVKSSKKKKKSKKLNASIDDEVSRTGNEEFTKSSKNKKKRKNSCVPDDIDKENSIVNYENLDCTKSSKKKNKNNLCDSDNIDDEVSKISDENIVTSKPSKKKNKKNLCDSDIIDQDSIIVDQNLDTSKPNKKKKKRKSDSHNIDEEDSKISDENLDCSKPSKKNKKNMSDSDIEEDSIIIDENLDCTKPSKKKKKKNTSYSDNIESDVKPSKKDKQMCTADAIENEDGLRSDKKKSKKRKREIVDDAVLEASAHSESEGSHNVENSPVLLDSSSKKKKSKKSKKNSAE